MRGLFLNNFGLKLVSLGLGVLMWLVIKMSLERENRLPPSLLHSAISQEQEYVCPVLALHAASNSQAFVVVPGEVTVRVSGDLLALRRLRTNDIQVYVRLLDPARYQGLVPLDVNLPRDIRLVNLQPSRVTVAPQFAR